jgi:trimeric autotransporter adhesin
MRTPIFVRGRVLGAFFGAVLGALSATTARAVTITVDTTSPDVAVDSKCSLAEAIQAANTDTAVDTCAAGLGADEIHLAAGTYEFLQAFDATDVLSALPHVTSPITIVGATADTTLLTMNAVASNLGFISLGQGASLTLRRLTVQKATNIAVKVPYGAATVVLDDCTFTKNRGDSALDVSGNGVSGNLTITNSRFTGNARGGVNVGTATATIDGTSFVANTGTAILQLGGDLTVTGCTFDQIQIGNGSPQGDSAISVKGGGTLHLSGSTFTNNTPQVEFSTLSLQGGSATVTECTFSGNQGVSIGIHATGTTVIDRTLIAGNQGVRAAVDASYPGTGAVTIKNSTITGNTSTRDSGGGIYADLTHNMVLNNVTITNNHAPSGGGIGFDNTSLATFRLANTLIAGNTDPNGSDDCATGNKFLTSDGYDLIGNGAGCTILAGPGDQVGTAQAPIDPKLGPLADNGGKTHTMGLYPGSPAIAHGSPGGDAGTACEAVDQRGMPRPVGSACDIGAFEGTLALPVADASMVDAPADVAAEAAADAAPEVALDAPADVAPEAAPDATADVAPEAAPDAPADVTQTAMDASPEADAGASIADAAVDQSAPHRDASQPEAAAAPSSDAGGCGCRTTDGGSGGGALACLVALLAVTARRRRSARTI